MYVAEKSRRMLCQPYPNVRKNVYYRPDPINFNRGRRHVHDGGDGSGRDRPLIPDAFVARPTVAAVRV